MYIITFLGDRTAYRLSNWCQTLAFCVVGSDYARLVVHLDLTSLVPDPSHREEGPGHVAISELSKCNVIIYSGGKRAAWYHSNTSIWLNTCCMTSGVTNGHTRILVWDACLYIEETTKISDLLPDWRGRPGDLQPNWRGMTRWLTCCGDVQVIWCQSVGDDQETCCQIGGDHQVTCCQSGGNDQVTCCRLEKTTRWLAADWRGSPGDLLQIGENDQVTCCKDWRGWPGDLLPDWRGWLGDLLPDWKKRIGDLLPDWKKRIGDLLRW